MRAAVSFALVLSVVLPTPHEGPSAPTSRTTDLRPTGEDFPELDGQLLDLCRRGTTNTLAREKLSTEPDRAETLELALRADRSDDALRVFTAIVQKRSDDLPRALALVASNSFRLARDDDGAVARTVGNLLTEARNRLNGLPREQEARLARVLLDAEARYSRKGRDERDALADFARGYADTEAGRIAAVQVALWRNESVDRFVTENPGTTIAAMALYEKGARLSTNLNATRGEDPTERLAKVVEIEKELESGRYPRSEWVDKAPSLVSSFYAFEPRYAQGNAARAIDIYMQFAATHLKLDGSLTSHSGVGYVVATKIPDILKRSGEGPDTVERVFQRLEEDPALGLGVQYLHAMYYVSRMNEPGSDRSTFYQKAQDALAAVDARGSGVLQRKALATLASLQFREGDYGKTRKNLQLFVGEYPTSDWAWVAALKLGWSEAALGDQRAAISAYEAAVARFPGHPILVALAETYRGRAHEALREFGAAVDAYRRALKAWDSDYGPTYSIYVVSLKQPKQPFGPLHDDARVQRSELSDRIGVLAATLRQPGGQMLEEGRWLAQNGHRDDAIATFERVVSRFPQSPAARDARQLAHRTRLDRALDLADVESVSADSASAARELEVLSSESLDFAVFAAQVTRAAMVWTEGQQQDAVAMATKVFDDWRAHQYQSMPRTPMTPLEADVVEIRNAVFRPAGDGVFKGEHWNAWNPPTVPPPFFVIASRISVKLTSGEMTEEQVARPLPDFKNVLFFSADEIRFFETLVSKIGGTKHRRPAAVMETPNQPVGGSMRVLAFLNRFFPARPGHWGGWVFETYPTITSVEFTNQQRTRALVRVTIGYSGGTVVLEKENGRWSPKRLVGRWIT